MHTSYTFFSSSEGFTCLKFYSNVSYKRGVRRSSLINPITVFECLNDQFLSHNVILKVKYILCTKNTSYMMVFNIIHL